MFDTAQPHAPAAPSSGKRRGETQRKHTVFMVLFVTTVALAMVTGLAVAFLYRHLEGNVNYEDIAGQLENRPDKIDLGGPGDPINVLVMGSDSREGEGNNIDGLAGGGQRSDTTILLHVSADRSRAYGISIPRDSLVDRPDCHDDEGDRIPGESDAMWNAAFGLGGPACTIQQFEQITGVRLDNYVVVDFQGFKDMVDALDGVEMCIPEDVVDPAHEIDIRAGDRVLRGDEALDYVRARYGIGDGSDIGRMRRQQAFIAAMANKVVSGDTLARPDRLVPFLGAVTSSITTDFDSLPALADLGLQMRGIGLNKIQFLTVPWTFSSSQPGRVEWQGSSKRLWRLIARDRELPPRFVSEAITAADDAKASRSVNRVAPFGLAAAEPEQPGITDEERENVGLCT